MQAVELIRKKRDGHVLDTDEIDWLIAEYMRDSIPDYQMWAWLMAVYWQGMDTREISDLTLAMAHSGAELHVRDTIAPVVDKHSTGGVGDKVTLAVAPLVAACGVAVGKMTGRGLGHTGGTVDKLESIQGFRAALSRDEFMRILTTHRIVLAGQSSDLAPADGKMYALRDVSGTVGSLPLIASSVMSKKIAAGTNCIVLDVKHGKGAFMKNLADATALARAMVEIGEGVGRKVRAVLSSMEQPLGYAVGNALEVKEAVETLQGRGPDDLVELALILGSQLLEMSGRAGSNEEARRQLRQALDSGAAFEKYKAFIAQQGGDVSYLDDTSKLPLAAHREEFPAPEGAFIKAI